LQKTLSEKTLGYEFYNKNADVDSKPKGMFNKPKNGHRISIPGFKNPVN
jgi:hypothetical protein